MDGRLLSLIILTLVSRSVFALTDSSVTSARWKQVAAKAAVLKPSRSFPYQHCFDKAAERHKLPVSLLLAVARGESDFDPKARSSANALGLMQILWPQTAKHLGIRQKAKLFDPCTNVDAGTRYLKELMRRYDGDLHLSLAAYNYGPGRIEPGASRIPKGALWYSGYILRHLDYVVGKGGNRGNGKRYAEEGQLELIHFARPFRAVALVDSLTRRRSDLRLDVFRRPAGVYVVVLLFDSAQERSQALRRLKTLGIEPV